MYIAQINVAQAKFPLEDARMAGFTDNLDRISALADESPGFVWRMKEEERTEEDVFIENLVVVNMSVWENIDSLYAYVYQTAHVEIFKGRKEWFEQISEMHMAFWYVEEGHIPSEQEAKTKLDYIRKHGETPFAFTFRKRFSEEEFRAMKAN